jgi:hypothetical protein
VKRNISFAIAAAATAGTTATALWLAVPAGAVSVSGTENFQIMTTSATSSTLSVIAHGVFTAAGVNHSGSKVDTLVFPNGSFKLTHTGKARQTFNPKTCLVTISEKAVITLSEGTGAYKGISGKGTAQASILAIGAKSGGKCSMTKPPVAFQQIIKATASVTL